MKSKSKPKTVPPGKRTENKNRTRGQILKAALDIFSKKGFYRATTKEIATKAKIAEGTLFNYFRTKEDLALYFFEVETDGLIQWYGDQKSLQKAPLAEKLFAIVNRHLERIAPYEEFIGAVYLRALQPASKLNPLSIEHQELRVRFLRFIKVLLDEAADNEEIPALGDLGAYGFCLFHLAFITYWLHDHSPGKEASLAMLDRSLNIASSILRKGGWQW